MAFGKVLAGPLDDVSEQLLPRRIRSPCCSVAQHRSELINPRDNRRTDIYAMKIGARILQENWRGNENQTRFQRFPTASGGLEFRHEEAKAIQLEGKGVNRKAQAARKRASTYNLSAFRDHEGDSRDPFLENSLSSKCS